jgi:hypothetical protein
MIRTLRAKFFECGSGVSTQRVRREASHRASVDEAASLVSRVADPILRSVLQHHFPVLESTASWPVCMGCDREGGAESEPAEWPCSAWTLIVSALPR